MHEDRCLWYNKVMIKRVADIADTEWVSVFQQVAASPPHDEFRVPKLGMPHPIDMGFRLASGYPNGSLAQYSYKTSGAGRIHIREYETCFMVHRDWGDPDSGLRGLILHLFNDSPEVLVGLGLLWLFLRDQQKETSSRRYVN